MAGDLVFTVEQEAMKAVAKALRGEADGKQLRKDLVAEIKQGLLPLREVVRGSILAMPGGLPHEGQPLRQTVAEKVVIEVRTGGRATGAGIKAKRKGMPRGFEHAPRRLNANKFRHPVFGGEVWVDQIGKPRWFDDPIRQHRGEYRKVVAATLAAMARRIAARSR